MKSYRDLSLYLVTHRSNLTFDAFFEVIEQAIQGGVTVVQLREKGTSKAEFIEIGKALLDRLRPKGIPLIINDSIEVALRINADGVHLGQSDSSVTEARRILGKKAIIGLSVETLEQALEAQALDIDYIGAQIYLTESKLNISNPWGLEGLKKLCRISRHPVIGIGGVNNDNIEGIINAGAAGVACLSAIFKAPLPFHAAQELMSKIKQQSRNQFEIKQRKL